MAVDQGGRVIGHRPFARLVSSAARGIDRVGRGAITLVRRTVFLALGLVRTGVHGVLGLFPHVVGAAGRLVSRARDIVLLIVHGLVGILRREPA